MTLRSEPNQRMNLREMLAHDFMTQNKIPDLLPISTLVCPPSATFVRQYLPAVGQAVSAMNDSLSSSNVF